MQYSHLFQYNYAKATEAEVTKASDVMWTLFKKKEEEKKQWKAKVGGTKVGERRNTQ